MAVFAATPVPAGELCVSATLAAAGASAEIVLGTNRLFKINATGDINIRFGNAGMVAAAATDYRVPGNTEQIWDTGDAFGSVRLFSTPGATYFIQKLSRS
jgi:hypothetical protein